MSINEEGKVDFPLSEKIKGIPGIFGIRVEEEPKFKVLEEDGPVEIRAYEPTLVAKTIVRGFRTEAMDQGFDILAAYIFGANASHQKIDMTNPVFEGPSLGTPLSASRSVDGNAPTDEWIVAFCLPKELTYNDAPLPNDDRVQVAEIPNRLIAVQRFSGTSSEANVAEATNELKLWIKASVYEAISEPIFAQYDPPFAVPMLRRNEIQIEVR